MSSGLVDSDGFQYPNPRKVSTRKNLMHVEVNRQVEVDSKVELPKKLVVVLDLQTVWLNEAFNPHGFEHNIVKKLEEDTSRTYTCEKFICYGVKDDHRIPEVHNRHVRTLRSLNKGVLLFSRRKLLCTICKETGFLPRKTRGLCELELLQQTWKNALSQRRLEANERTSFLVVSNDPFFKYRQSTKLREMGFEVFTYIFDGMDPQVVRRPKVDN